MTEAKFTYYNAEKDITLKEYGRNIQNLVDSIVETPDRDKRNRLARTAIELMRQLNPSVQENTQDYTQKLWDDLFIISDFRLDVDCPYPKPETDVLFKRPERMSYPSGRIRYKHYGRTVENMIQKAKQLETEEERKAAAIAVGKLMKMFYKAWNKESIEDAVILEQLENMSEGMLTLSLEQVQRERLFDMEKPKYVSGGSYSNRNHQQRKHQLSSHNGRKNNNNDHRNNKRK